MRATAVFRATLPLVLIALVTAGAEWLVLSGTEANAMAAREAARRQTAVETRIMADAFRETVSRSLDEIDALHGIAGLVIHARRSGNQTMEHEALAQLSAASVKLRGYVLQVSAIAPSGYVDWTTLQTQGDAVYFGDRAYFRVIADGHARTGISDPLNERVSGQRVIRFAKGQYGPDGALWGVSVVSLDPVAFSGLGAALGVVGSDSVALLRSDGLVLARNLGGEGTATAGSETFRQFQSAVDGTLVAPSPVDGFERSVAWHRIDDAGLIVGVGLNLQARLDQLEPILRDAAERSRINGLLAGIVGIGVAAGWLWRERLAAETARTAQIRKNEKQFRQIAESLPDLTCLINRDGRILYANPAARDLLGQEPSALIGADSALLIPPEAVSTQLGQDDLHSQNRRAEIRFTRPGGQEVWLQTTLRVIRGGHEQSGAAWTVSSSQDVTERRKAEIALRRTKEELDAVLEAAAGVLFRTEVGNGEKVRATFVSDSVESLTGFTASEAMEAGWLESRYHPASSSVFAEHFQRLRTHGSSKVQYRFQHKDGRWLWFQAFVRAVPEGTTLSLVGYLLDITRQHERDQQIAQSAKMATLGELTTGIAAELMQPLAAISMLAQNAMAFMDPGRPAYQFVRQKLERIISQVDRAASVADRMRIFNRSDQSRNSRVTVAEAISGAIAILDTKLRDTGIEIVSAPAGGIPPVRGDLVSLEQVLVNLIGNAVDAITLRPTPLPPERLRIGVSATSKASVVVLTVADRAGGIAPAALPRLFEPFFTTKPAGAGTGLGLSISYGMIADMGGTLTARNEGDGAVFEIQLLTASPEKPGP